MPTVEQMATMAVEGTTVAFADHARDPGGSAGRTSGDPILLIHGGVFADWFAPLALDPALAGHRVVRVVRAGYAPRPAPAAAVGVSDHARHCAALLDGLCIERAHLVGHSSGSVIALQLALDRPEVVQSLVLSEPPLIDSLAAPEDLGFCTRSSGPRSAAPSPRPPQATSPLRSPPSWERSAGPTTAPC